MNSKETVSLRYSDPECRPRRRQKSNCLLSLSFSSILLFLTFTGLRVAASRPSPLRKEKEQTQLNYWERLFYSASVATNSRHFEYPAYRENSREGEYENKQTEYENKQVSNNRGRTGESEDTGTVFKKESSTPSNYPSIRPSIHPIALSSVKPSQYPTMHPSQNPSMKATNRPSYHPSAGPITTKETQNPTIYPSQIWSMKSTNRPIYHPSAGPSTKVTRNPSSKPSPMLWSSNFQTPIPIATEKTQNPTSKPSRMPLSSNLQTPIPTDNLPDFSLSKNARSHEIKGVTLNMNGDVELPLNLEQELHLKEKMSEQIADHFKSTSNIQEFITEDSVFVEAILRNRRRRRMQSSASTIFIFDIILKYAVSSGLPEEQLSSIKLSDEELQAVITSAFDASNSVIFLQRIKSGSNGEWSAFSDVVDAGISFEEDKNPSTESQILLVTTSPTKTTASPTMKQTTASQTQKQLTPSPTIRKLPDGVEKTHNIRGMSLDCSGTMMEITEEDKVFLQKTLADRILEQLKAVPSIQNVVVGNALFVDVTLQNRRRLQQSVQRIFFDATIFYVGDKFAMIEGTPFPSEAEIQNAISKAFDDMTMFFFLEQIKGGTSAFTFVDNLTWTSPWSLMTVASTKMGQSSNIGKIGGIAGLAAVSCLSIMFYLHRRRRMQRSLEKEEDDHEDEDQYEKEEEHWDGKDGLLGTDLEVKSKHDTEQQQNDLQGTSNIGLGTEDLLESEKKVSGGGTVTKLVRTVSSVIGLGSNSKKIEKDVKDETEDEKEGSEDEKEGSEDPRSIYQVDKDGKVSFVRNKNESNTMHNLSKRRNVQNNDDEPKEDMQAKNVAMRVKNIDKVGPMESYSRQYDIQNSDTLHYHPKVSNDEYMHNNDNIHYSDMQQNSLNNFDYQKNDGDNRKSSFKEQSHNCNVISPQMTENMELHDAKPGFALHSINHQESYRENHPHTLPRPPNKFEKSSSKKQAEAYLQMLSEKKSGIRH